MTVGELIRNLQYYKPEAVLHDMETDDLNRVCSVCLIGVPSDTPQQSSANKIYISLFPD